MPEESRSHFSADSAYCLQSRTPAQHRVSPQIELFSGGVVGGKDLSSRYSIRRWKFKGDVELQQHVMILLVELPAWPGDSRSLTVPGVNSGDMRGDAVERRRTPTWDGGSVCKGRWGALEAFLWPALWQTRPADYLFDCSRALAAEPIRGQTSSCWPAGAPTALSGPQIEPQDLSEITD